MLLLYIYKSRRRGKLRTTTIFANDYIFNSDGWLDLITLIYVTTLSIIPKLYVALQKITLIWLYITICISKYKS